MPTMALATAARIEPPGSSGMLPPASRTSCSAGRSGRCRSSGSMVGRSGHAGLRVALPGARPPFTETPHTGYERLPVPPHGGTRPAWGTLLKVVLEPQFEQAELPQRGPVEVRAVGVGIGQHGLHQLGPEQAALPRLG